MKRERYKSHLLSAVHETARDMNKLGVIDKHTMREYDLLCIDPVSAYSEEKISLIRVEKKRHNAASMKAKELAGEVAGMFLEE